MELALRTVGVVRTINALRDTLARQGCTQAQCDQAVRIFEEHVILGLPGGGSRRLVPRSGQASTDRHKPCERSTHSVPRLELTPGDVRRWAIAPAD
jgi:hypothetical protein